MFPRNCRPHPPATSQQRRRAPRFAGGLVALGVCVAVAACDEPKKPEVLSNDRGVKLDRVAKKEEKKAPSLSIDRSGPRVGFDLFVIDGTNGPTGLSKLQDELEAQKEWLDGKDVKLEIHRQAKLPWVTTFLGALEEKGVKTFVVTTGTRKGYPTSVTFSALSTVKDAAPCSVVTMIREGGNTATWKLAGGAARQRRRGLSGPDLSTTSATIESVAKSCDSSETLFVSADPTIQWGLVFDLAASTTVLKETTFSKRALLSATPSVGKRVKL